MTTGTKTVAVQSEIWLFEIPMILKGVFEDDGTDKKTRFSVRVVDMTLGDVLRYVLDVVGNQTLHLDPPWNAIEKIRLDSFEFIVEIKNGETSYGLSYNQLDVDLGFASFDKLEVFYKVVEAKNRALDVNIFGTFLGVSFEDNPISWDALKEQPPQSPAGSAKVFTLDYLGLGQRVTLRDVANYQTIGEVMEALTASYFPPDAEKLDPLQSSQNKSLVYDESAAWLVGVKFSVLETFDFQGLWNLPTLAGARIALSGERAKSLAGFEFEILYRKIAEDLGQYHIELVLPDVLRKFQAGAASVTLPIIAIEIYTDGGFKIDLGFPENMNFERSFSIELMIGPFPVTGGLGIYFGRLSPKAVPGLPAITSGDFGPVIIAGAGFRIGFGKSITAGILEAGFFLGIEGMVEGVVGFFEPWEKAEPKATYYKVTGTIQLTGHIYGKVNFAIISAEVDIYAYISVSGTFEAYRATVLVFEAGVRVKLTIKINLGLFKIPIKLSFSATIREKAVIGSDEQTPWQIEAEVGTTLKERLGPVGYRSLPTGEIVANEYFARMLDPVFDWERASVERFGDLRPKQISEPDQPDKLHLYFRPVTSLGLNGDRPGGTIDPTLGESNLIASLMLRTSRKSEESFSPAETFAKLVLRYGLAKPREGLWLAGANLEEDTISLSELTCLQDQLDDADSHFVIAPKDVETFFQKWAAPIIELAPWTNENDGDGTELTPFPIIPLMSVVAIQRDEETQTDKEVYSHNFETTPLCSEEYQQDIKAYFENLDPMRETKGTPVEAVLRPDGKSFSMAQLIFIDCFKLTLRQIVAEAVNFLTLAKLKADGRSITDLAKACGMANPAGIARIVEANIDNKKLFPVDQSLAIARDAALLSGTSNLIRLGKRTNQLPLACARSIYREPVLSGEASIKLRGVRYCIQPDDTQQLILDLYHLTDWEQIEKANPLVDWSVPPDSKDPKYPTMSLPAGTWISIPEFSLPPAADRSIASLCEGYSLTPADVIWKPAQIKFDPAKLARMSLTTLVGEDETIAMVASRFSISSDALIDASLLNDPAVLSTERALEVPPGSYLIARGDTLESIAAVHQTTPFEIWEANKGEEWRLKPRPDYAEDLPMGVEIKLPSVEKFLPEFGATFARIAELFKLDPKSLALHNAEKLALTTGALVYLPVLTLTTSESCSPLQVAAKYAVTPEGILRANQGVEGGTAPLGEVIVPDCEQMAESEFFDRLANHEGGSKLKAASEAQSRFLLAGLRLPNPEADPATDKQLWPLYTLTGQQWPAPTDLTKPYWVQLRWNDDSDPAKKMALAAFKDQEEKPLILDPEPAHLTSDDFALISEFAALGANPSALAPSGLVPRPYPAFQQIRIEKTLGAATTWTIPAVISFGGPPPKGDVIQPLLIEIPMNVRSVLPTDGEKLAPLEISEISPEPISGKPARNPITNAGWATGIELQIRQSFGSEDDGEPLKATYEAISIDAQGQADLEGLRDYIHTHESAPGQNPIDIYLLYSTDPLAASPDGMSCDATTVEARSKIALLKANLSTFSNPAASFSAVGLFEDGANVTSATLTEGERFLDLLWQISVTNGGGFFLNYPEGADGPGLPDSLFEAGDTARITLLVACRIGDPTDNPYLPTVAPAKFHNTLVAAQNLTSAKATVELRGTTKSVDYVAGFEPQVTQSLSEIAGEMLSVEDLIDLNRSNHTLLHVGATITPTEGEPYTVKLGDDLLGVSKAMGLDASAFATLVGPLTGLLEYQSVLAMRPGWFTGKSRVEPEQGGFEIIRPQPVPTDVAAEITHEEAIYRLQTMFQLMGYSLDGDDAFTASNHGLSIIPDEPDKNDPLARYGMNAEALQPWVYRRLLPIAPFAKSGPFHQLTVVDPYAGLGKAARVSFGFQDVFGNRLPSASGANSIDWSQLYRDPLLPLHSWPSVTLAYDVANCSEKEVTCQTKNIPQVQIRVKFAPAGYVAEIGQSFKRLKNRAEADQKRFALAYYQVADERVNVKVTTSLTEGVENHIDTKLIADFAQHSFEYLEAIQQLQPQLGETSLDSTLAGLASAANVTIEQIAHHLAEQPRLLNPAKKVLIRERITLMPNMSLEEISKLDKGNPDPGSIGVLNENVPVAPDLVLTVAHQDYKTVAGDTLKKISRGIQNVEEIATANREVKGLFSEGTVLFLGLIEAEIKAEDTLGKIAAAHAVSIEDIARTNAREKFFADRGVFEFPFQLAIAPTSKPTARIGGRQSLAEFVQAHGAAIRDILTANSSTTSLLKEGAKVVYPKGPSQGVITEKVAANDTWATITLRIAAKVEEPSLKAADVGAYGPNSASKTLYVENALLLLPPIRFDKNINVAHALSSAVIIDRLGVEISINRKDASLIDPAFDQVPEVERVTSKVAARLSSQFSRTERSTILAFTRQFQETFDNLKLCIGPDTFTSVSPRALLAKEKQPDSKLVAVNWSAHGFGVAVSGPPRFFAPKPLLREPWNRNDVPIKPYKSGQPLAAGSEVETNFSNADLERWALSLMQRIDRILRPDLAAPLRALSPANFTAITGAKKAIAKAVSKSVQEVLKPEFAENPPDLSSAAEQLEQQLLVELAKTYRGGVVAQFDVKATTPEGGSWTAETAPRLLCSASPVLFAIPDQVTLVDLADHFGTSYQVLGSLLKNVGNVLQPGYTIPVGSKPEVKLGETIVQVAKCAGVSAEQVIKAINDKPGALRGGAEIPLAKKTVMTEVDETFLSALERLAPNMTSENLLDFSIDVFVQINGDKPSIFKKGIELKWEGKEPYATNGEECFNDLVHWFKEPAVYVFKKFLVAAPLLKQQVAFDFLTRLPPVTASAAKITLFSESGYVNKLNTVVVNSMPDEASSLPLQLAFKVQAMEFNVHDVVDGGDYQASEWLTFIDNKIEQTPDAFELPVPNRQFPIPPQVLDHWVAPTVEDGHVNPARIEDVLFYDYRLRFAFDASSQDEITYTRYEPSISINEDGVDELTAFEALAYKLAQFQAIEKALFDDIVIMRSWDGLEPGEGPRKVVGNAVQIFSDLAAEIGEHWEALDVALGETATAQRDAPAGEVFRIRRHEHPDGTTLLTVIPDADCTPKWSACGKIPQASILGRPTQSNSTSDMTMTSHLRRDDEEVEGVPVPRTRTGDYYQILDPDLNLLVYQKCWGGISVLRNRRLVEGTKTADEFVLRIPDVRPITALTPAFTYSQRIDLGKEIGPLAERLNVILERIFFPDGEVSVPSRQRVSATMAFTRPSATAKNAAMVEPADWKSMFVPVSTTPLIEMDKDGADEKPTPKIAADTIAEHLAEFLSGYDLAPHENWSFTLKLFSHLEDKDTPPQLLEIIDVRVRMSEQ